MGRSVLAVCSARPAWNAAARCEPVSCQRTLEHFLKDFGKAGRLWRGLAHVACEQSAVQCGYAYWGELRDNRSSSGSKE